MYKPIKAQTLCKPGGLVCCCYSMEYCWGMIGVGMWLQGCVLVCTNATHTHPSNNKLIGNRLHLFKAPATGRMVRGKGSDFSARVEQSCIEFFIWRHVADLVLTTPGCCCAVGVLCNCTKWLKARAITVWLSSFPVSSHNGWGQGHLPHIYFWFLFSFPAQASFHFYIIFLLDNLWHSKNTDNIIKIIEIGVPFFLFCCTSLCSFGLPTHAYKCAH